MLNKLNVIIRRIEQRVASKDYARQKLQASIEEISKEVNNIQKQKDQFCQHLASLVIVGETNLDALLENKTRQGVIQRKLAENDLMLADKRQKMAQMTQQLVTLKSERDSLQKKADKFTELLHQHRRREALGRENLTDMETEERINWQK